MKKLYLLSAFLCFGCIPEDFKLDGNIVDQRFDQLDYYCNKNMELKSLSTKAEMENRELGREIQDLS